MSTFTALHQALGRPRGELTAAMVDDAVNENIAERGDLDFKRDLPPTSKLAASDFPKDVAAMANSGGGTIIYGVEETAKRATGRHDVEMTENHERSLRAVARSAITPPIMHLSIDEIGEPGHRYVAIVVPASPDVPHLIYRDEQQRFFGAPVRTNADTTWMSERMIEAAYRARFTQHRDRVGELAELYARAADGWEADARASFVAAAVPQTSRAADHRMTIEEARACFAAAQQPALDLAVRGAGVHPFDDGLDMHNLRRSLRSWYAPPHRSENASWRTASASVGDFGTVTLAAIVGGHRSGPHSDWAGHQVEITAIECALADFLALVRTTGSRLGVHDYDVHLGMPRKRKAIGLRFLLPDPRAVGRVLGPFPIL